MGNKKKTFKMVAYILFGLGLVLFISSLVFFYNSGNATSAPDEDAFADLKAVADKIIPNDPWAFLIQLTSTFVLVLILSKFLVTPAKNFIAARTEYVKNNIEQAAKKNEEADAKLLTSEKALKEARANSKAMVDEAKINALNEKDRIIEETKNEVLDMKNKAKEDIENTKKQIKEQLSKEVIDVAIAAASKVVEREVNDSDNKKIIESFINDKDN